MAMSEADPDSDAIPADDARLLAELRPALDPSPTPAGLVERAEGLFGYLNADRDLAELLDESAAEPAGTRGPVAAGGRLFFEVDRGSVALEVQLAQRGLTGQVLSGQPSAVVFERLSGEVRTCPVDGLGRFAFDEVPTGPARLRLV